MTKEVGICRARIERYYFNSVTGRCEQFIYGGCGGNENNFETLEACNRQCRGIICPVFRCLRACPAGYEKDENGCQTCNCICPAIQCPIRCPNGYMKDEYGCPSCKCKFICPVPLCRAPCPNGFKKNDKGCQTCDCAGKLGQLDW